MKVETMQLQQFLDNFIEHHPHASNYERPQLTPSLSVRRGH